MDVAQNGLVKTQQEFLRLISVDAQYNTEGTGYMPDSDLCFVYVHYLESKCCMLNLCQKAIASLSKRVKTCPGREVCAQ